MSSFLSAPPSPKRKQNYEDYDLRSFSNNYKKKRKQSVNIKPKKKF